MTVRATPPSRILRVGLTGGIACGKSTVARFLSELGAFVLDADHLAHMAISPGGAAYAEVVARFGTDILDEHGLLVRSKLAGLVFDDAGLRDELNAIVHPRVRAEADRRITERARLGLSPVAVMDAALLVESGSYRDFDRLLVVNCPREVQLRRLQERDELNYEQAAARIDAQAPAEEKTRVADFVIDTSVPLDQTRREVERIYAILLGDFENRFGDETAPQ
jgi:dephospho-CoA kinase